MIDLIPVNAEAGSLKLVLQAVVECARGHRFAHNYLPIVAHYLTWVRRCRYRGYRGGCHGHRHLGHRHQHPYSDDLSHLRPPY